MKSRAIIALAVMCVVGVVVTVTIGVTHLSTARSVAGARPARGYPAAGLERQPARRGGPAMTHSGLHRSATVVTPSSANTYGLWFPVRGNWVVGCTWEMGGGGGTTCGPHYHCPNICPAIDFARNPSGSIGGNPVYAAANGTAHIYAQGNTCGSGSGNVVWVNHGNGLTTWYYHLRSIAFSGTPVVTPYTQIGTVGCTGNVQPPTYNHLHFEVRLNNSRISNRVVVCQGGTRHDYPFVLGHSDWPQVPLWQPISNDGPWCNSNALKSAANSKYVSAELDYTGSNYAMLRARATAIGGWEKFKFIGDCALTTGCLIKSTANSRYVAAELNYTGSNQYMLRARTSGSPGSWERFWIKQCDTSAGCLIKSVAAGKYTAAELDFTGSRYGMLRARTNPADIGARERFRLAKG